MSIRTTVKKELSPNLRSKIGSVYDSILRLPELPAAYLHPWRRESITLGRMVNVIAPDKSYQGKAVNIDSDGALLVETEGGMERVLAGDVSIRPA